MPDCITHYDWSRSYLLPEHVHSTIPRRGSVGMLGAHNAARGLLVELCRYTGTTPTALRYREADLHPDGDLVVVTAVATRPDGSVLVVTTRTRHRRIEDRPGDWTITINGRPLPGEDRVYPPSPPLQALIAARHSRPAAPD